MAEFTRAGDIDPGVNVPLRIGDVWRDRTMLTKPAGGTVWIADLLPVDAETPEVVVYEEDGVKPRQRMQVSEFRRRFAFRSHG